MRSKAMSLKPRAEGRTSRCGVLVLVCASLCCVNAGTPTTQDRDPIGAGTFYSRSPATLKAALQTMLAEALPPRPERPVAIVVPHAGYVYSGQIAADAYRQAAAHKYDTIVIVGTNHTDGNFRKVAIFPGKSFRTPLGNAPIDEDFAGALQKEDSDCVLDATPHRAEHSVELQVLFAQQAFPAAKVVPLVVGRPEREMCVRLGRALAAVSRDRKVLLVASSDLSHFPSAQDAFTADRQTIEAIAAMDVDRFYDLEFNEERRPAQLETRACGSGPIMTVIAAARQLGANRATALSYANSADVAVGDPTRVVGYGSVVFTSGDRSADVAAIKPVVAVETPLTPGDKKALLALARQTIQRFLTTETLPLARNFPASTLKNRGVFVTLKKGGDLRGCIGHIPGDSQLLRLVSAMAYASAFQDPRFSKVTLPEVPDLEIEISVLSPPKLVNGPADIVVGRDGVFITADGTGAVFLPQVATEQGWNRDQMLSELCLKAGLPANRWRRDGVKYSTFQAEIFSERDFK